MIDKIGSTQVSAVQAQTLSPAKHIGEERPEPEKKENRDEYVTSKEKEPIGLYNVSQDEDGGRRVSYDAPDNSSEKEQAPAENGDETVTANTDKVDREIKELREKSQTLTEKLRSADPEKADEIRRELDAVSRELSQKDNDQYRRQNTVFS